VPKLQLSKLVGRQAMPYGKSKVSNTRQYWQWS
jgi:hypothetical protein